jgi:hypothetical protein
MRPVWKEGRVTMRSVFAARVMLDIHEICLNFDGKTLLYDQGHRQNQYFEYFIDDQGALDMRSGLRWLLKDMGLVKEIYLRIDMKMLKPAVPHLKQEAMVRNDAAPITFMSEEDMKSDPSVRIWRSAPLKALSGSLQPQVLDDPKECPEETRRELDETAKKLNLCPIQPHRDTYLYMNKNPLYCGTLLLSHIVSAETAGIALANVHQAVFAVAHLYNALHKMNLTKVAWPDLDRIIELQRGPFFADDIPSTPEEMQARVWYRLGVERTGTRFIADRKTPTKKNLVPSPASALLLQFFRSKQPLETTMYQLQAKMEQKQLAEKRQGVAKGAKTKPSTLLSQGAFINQLQDVANTAIADTNIPYLGLTKLCIHLLEYVIERLQRSGYKPLPKTDYSVNEDLVQMVADILLQNNDSWKKTKKPGVFLLLASIEYRRMCDYMNSDRFKENWPLHSPYGDVEESEARSSDKEHVRGW